MAAEPCEDCRVFLSVWWRPSSFTKAGGRRGHCHAPEDDRCELSRQSFCLRVSNSHWHSWQSVAVGRITSRS